MRLEKECYPLVSAPAVHAIIALGEIGTKNNSPVTLRYCGQSFAISSASDFVLALNPSCKKLWLYILALVTRFNSAQADKWGNAVVKFTLKEYMARMNIKNTRTNRHQVYTTLQKDIADLGMLRLEAGESLKIFGFLSSLALFKTNGDKGTKSDVLNDRGYFQVRISGDWLGYLDKARQIIPFYPDLLRLAGKNNNALAVGNRMLQHCGMLINADSSGQYVLNVGKLWELCPDKPTREADIHASFEKAIGALSVFGADPEGFKIHPLFVWKYKYMGKLYTAKEIKPLKLPHSAWLNLMIVFEVLTKDCTFSDEDLSGLSKLT